MTDTAQISETIADGAAKVRQAIIGAEAAAASGPKPIHNAYTRARRTGGPVRDLPAGCPVEPLGVMRSTRYYLDALRQLVELPADKHNRTNILGLFGNRIDFLHDHFTRTNKKGDPDGWRPEQAAECLMTACADRGVWDPFDRVRGSGSWMGRNGELIMHCGDAIWFGSTVKGARGNWHQPGLVDGYVYPAESPLPRPDDEAADGGEAGVGSELLEMLASWNWRRDKLDAQLLLGWIGAGIIGGALKWRPLAWITGGKGTGKSTLHEVLKGVCGDALVAVSDASAAGVWQKLGYRTVPVAFDELEAEEDNRKANNVIKLARQAASGGVVLRGGSDHQSSQFMARSCFLFSSILVPPLLGQDRSRMAILELGELSKTVRPPNLDPKRLAKMGRQLRRRLADGWWRWQETFDGFRNALVERGHSARGADQFGTLLAMADILIADTLPLPEEYRNWAERLEDSNLSEREDDDRDEQRCLGHLLSTVIDPYRNGQRTTVGEWVVKAAGLQPDGPQSEAFGEKDQKDANAALGTYGMKVVKGVSGTDYLAIANYHQGLSSIFSNTHWAGRSGTQGVWVQAVRRLPGAEIYRKVIWLGGQAVRATVVPISSVITRNPTTDADAQLEGY